MTYTTIVKNSTMTVNLSIRILQILYSITHLMPFSPTSAGKRLQLAPLFIPLVYIRYSLYVIFLVDKLDKRRQSRLLHRPELSYSRTLGLFIPV